MKQKLVGSFEVMLLAFRERYNSAGIETKCDELLQSPIELPQNLVGIFDNTPRILPKGIFLSNAQQMSRSRTLSMFSSSISSNFRSSVPDLSRSVPNTPVFYKHGRTNALSEAQDGAYSSMPRPSRPQNNSDKNTSLVKYPSGSYGKGLESVKLSVTEEPEEQDVVKINTLSMVSPTQNIKEQSFPALSTFKASHSPSTKFRETRDGIVLNRFDRNSFIQDDEVGNLRLEAHSLLHSSSSFVIKRPSFMPERNTNLNASYSLHNIQETYSRNQSRPHHQSERNLAGEKAAALLDEVDPKLRATLKTDQIYHDKGPFDGFLLQKGPKFTIPRIVPNSAEKQNNKDVDSLA